MLNKHKILLSIIQEFDGEIEEERFELLIFILSQYSDCQNVYSFIAINNILTSLTLLHDKQILISQSLLEKSNDWVISKDTQKFINELNMFERMNISKLKKDFENTDLDNLVHYVQNNYLGFFKKVNVTEDTSLYTIGYEGISLEEYLNKLQNNGIKVLCDVRKNAYSQKFGFSKNELQKALDLIGVKYVHIPELGTESESRQNINDYLVRLVLFKEYKESLVNHKSEINLLINLIQDYKKIAITCFEKEHKMCHRSKVAEFVLENKLFVGKVVHL